jgi:enoyl-CoA hydratase
VGVDYAQFEYLEIEQDDKLLVISLNRPDSLNAINGPMHEEIQRVFPLISADRSVGAVLLRGNGRTFCAGGDVKWMAGAASGEEEGFGPVEKAKTLLADGRHIVDALINVRQPLICAVHGYAMGLGATLALCSDIVIAAEDATLGDSHISIGMVPADGGTLLWPLLLPLNTAKYYLMTGKRLTGADAHRLGLIQECVSAADLDASSRQLAKGLADGPTLALEFTKSVLNKIIRERADFILETSLLMEAVTMSSADHAEATAAFVDKRPPRYTGR